MYRNILSKAFELIILMCALITLFYFTGDLIGWFDISSVFPFRFIMILTLFSTTLSVTLTSKYNVTYILKCISYSFSYNAGVGCILISLNVTFEQGMKTVIILQGILIMLYSLAFSLDFIHQKVNQKKHCSRYNREIVEIENRKP